MSNSEFEGIPLFAAIKTFYENGNDILSAVCSLVLVTITDDDTITQIQTNFKEKYKVAIPTPVLQTVLKRLKRNDLLSYDGHFTFVTRTTNGCFEADKLQSSINDLNREFKALINSLNKFFDAKKYTRLSSADKALLKFIDDNLGFASHVLASSDSVPDNKSMSRIAEYILHVEKSEPEIYILLQNVFFGRLYLSMIRTRTEYSSNVNMEPTDLYLDTSILMSLLGLHGKLDKESSSELIGVLSAASNVNICVFDETLDESRRLLESSINGIIDYTKNISVSSIPYELKKQGYDRHRVSLLIESLPQKVEELGLQIRELPASERTQEYNNIESNLSTWCELINAPKGQKTLDHDTKILHAISVLRYGVRSKLFEKSKAVFISPDRAIHHLTDEIANSKSQFPLSLQPLEVASMLWMRDIGNANIATNVLRQSMMAYVREKAISQKLWETFVSALKDAQGKDILTREDIALILSSDDVSILLAEKQFEAPKQIISTKYIEGLRTERTQLSHKAKFGDSLLNAVENRIHQMAHIGAISGTVIIGLVVTAVLFALTWLCISKIGLDTLANLVAIVILLLGAAALFTFGRELKFAKLIIDIRKKLHDNIYHSIKFKLDQIFNVTESENA